MRRAPWWKYGTIYQIYPKSFADSDGDGIGDLRGIIQHIDHLERLGIAAVWLSPIYPSPQADNGYDIADYCGVDPLFGTLNDFDELLAALHERGIRLIMDLVVNHTSDRHPWFEASRSRRDNPLRDWYWWHSGRTTADGRRLPPNDWGAFFSGSAWTYDEETDEYYLGLFSAHQPDLNWENPAVRQAVHQVMNWWVDRGVDGFRMDVINYISKVPTLDPGVPLPSGFEDGAAHFSFGPRLREFLAEAKQEVFGGRTGSFLTVGETPGATPQQALQLVGGSDPVVDMVFQFEHVDLDHVEAMKFELRPAGAPELAASLVRWQRALAENGWNSLYLSNHDQPRPVSRFGDPESYRYASATALATMQHLMRGTPYVYQGEELGLPNPPITSADELRDIESINYYRGEVAAGRDPEEVLEILRRKARDNARSPMPWTATPGAGFTSGVPWAPLAPDLDQLNAAAEASAENSVFAYYRRLIDLRRESEAVALGDFTAMETGDEAVLAYRRTFEDDVLVVLINLSSDVRAYRILDPLRSDAAYVLGNRDRARRDLASAGTLEPWEAAVWATPRTDTRPRTAR